MRPSSGLFSALLITFAFCILCPDAVSQVKPKTSRPAKEPYASMPVSEKLKVQEKLVAQLKNDRDFLAIKKITKGMVDQGLAMRSKGINLGSKDKNANTPEAKKMREDMLDVMVKNLTLIKKYPEIDQLDAETRRKVFKEAELKK